MKIQKIELKDFVIKEVDGEYEQVFINEKTYPAFLTNYALKKGREMGLLQSSLMSELFKWGESEIDSMSDRFDESKMLTIIYVAFLGANPNTDLSYDEFLSKYHYSIEETMELYVALVDGLSEPQKNNFADGLQKSTDNSTTSKKNENPLK